MDSQSPLGGLALLEVLAGLRPGGSSTEAQKPSQKVRDGCTISIGSVGSAIASSSYDGFGGFV